jgi:hypothetical protein
MTWRTAHTIVLIIGAVLWVAIWYAAGSIVWWIFGGR